MNVYLCVSEASTVKGPHHDWFRFGGIGTVPPATTESDSSGEAGGTEPARAPYSRETHLLKPPKHVHRR